MAAISTSPNRCGHLASSITASVGRRVESEKAEGSHTLRADLRPLSSAECRNQGRLVRSSALRRLDSLPPQGGTTNNTPVALALDGGGQAVLVELFVEPHAADPQFTRGMTAVVVVLRQRRLDLPDLGDLPALRQGRPGRTTAERGRERGRRRGLGFGRTHAELDVGL